MCSISAATNIDWLPIFLYVVQVIYVCTVLTHSEYSNESVEGESMRCENLQKRDYGKKCLSLFMDLCRTAFLPHVIRDEADYDNVIEFIDKLLVRPKLNQRPN